MKTWMYLKSTWDGLLKNVKYGISRHLGSQEIQKTKVAKCFAGHPVCCVCFCLCLSVYVSCHLYSAYDWGTFSTVYLLWEQMHQQECPPLGKLKCLRDILAGVFVLKVSEPMGRFPVLSFVKLPFTRFSNTAVMSVTSQKKVYSRENFVWKKRLIRSIKKLFFSAAKPFLVFNTLP